VDADEPVLPVKHRHHEVLAVGVMPPASVCVIDISLPLP
jgi:hypothetical protein